MIKLNRPVVVCVMILLAGSVNSAANELRIAGEIGPAILGYVVYVALFLPAFVAISNKYNK
jgi:lipopolysaccharide export LptBFGC system permease protein LptF